MEQNTVKKEPLGKNFYVNVSHNHTFGTDAILLSNFASASRKDRAVDLGTGCGIIPLIMLRDGLLESAVGVDISSEATLLAEQTKNELGLENFTVINSDLNDLKGKIEFGHHTLITCNPPYKAPGAGIISSSETDKAARHETACTLEDIISVSSRLLQTSGRLCMCHRPERLAEMMDLMRENKLEPNRLRLVCKQTGEEPWLVLVEAKKCAKTGLRIAPTLYVYENGELSSEMIEIYGSYKEAYL